VFASIFNVILYVNNRLDLRNLVHIANLLFRTGCIVLFFSFVSAGLASVGIAYFLGALFALAISMLLWRKIGKGLKIKRSCFDISKLKELTGMGGWLIVNQIGALLFLQIDIILVNILFGPASAGKYAAIIQWSFLLRSMAGVGFGVLLPIILISHAKGEHEKIVFIAKKAVKFMCLAMALPIGLLCGFAKPLLMLWLGEDFAVFSPLMIILVAHLVINLSVLPLFAINTALNRVRIPGIVTMLMGIGNVALAIVLSKRLGWGIYGIALAGTIMLTAKNAIFTPVYAAHILKIHYATFIKPIGHGILLTIFGICISLILRNVITIDGWSGFFLPAGSVFLISLLAALGLLGKDRKYLFYFKGQAI
jgi:membrane protein EpsK